YRTGNGTMYPTAILEFLNYMELNNFSFLGDITSERIINYYNYLIERPSKKRKGALSNATINHHLFALRLMVKLLQDTGQTENRLVVPPNHETDKKKKVLSFDEIKALFLVCENNLEKAILALAYGCGLRKNEICTLNIKDIDFTRASILVRFGKGNKIRQVPMSDRAKKLLHDYLTSTRLVSKTYPDKENFYSTKFLLTHQGNFVSGSYLNRILKKLLAKTPVSPADQRVFSLHSLRHAIATHLAENGVDIEFVSEFLGHETIDTSSLYMIRRKRSTGLLVSNYLR
ncbi:MAG: tyrosine-type recombinase/integrase, partial [Crocinitomicaceae bacterium]|nr:tyrosine-type recombinase/integrase [Crocinitomicaceae bacterium]